VVWTWVDGELFLPQHLVNCRWAAALFHIAAPHRGPPFFFEVVERGWFRPGTRWEEVDMDRCTVLQYPVLSAERLEHWARVAFRRWALRPGPRSKKEGNINAWHLGSSLSYPVT
jgi:hypothetical protein